MTSPQLPVDVWRDIFNYVSFSDPRIAVLTLNACARLQKSTADDALQSLYSINQRPAIHGPLATIRGKWSAIIRSALPTAARADYHRPYYMYLEKALALDELWFLAGHVLEPLLNLVIDMDNFEIDYEAALPTADLIFKGDFESWLPPGVHDSREPSPEDDWSREGRRLALVLKFCKAVATQLLKLIAQTQRDQGRTTRLGEASTSFFDVGVLLDIFDHVSELHAVWVEHLTKAVAEQFARHPSPPRSILVDGASYYYLASTDPDQNLRQFYANLPPDALNTLTGDINVGAARVRTAEEMQAITRQTRLECLAFSYNGAEIDALAPISRLSPSLEFLAIWALAIPEDEEQIDLISPDASDSIRSWVRTLDKLEYLTVDLTASCLLAPLGEALLLGGRETLPQLKSLDIATSPEELIDLRVLFAMRMCRGLGQLTIDAGILLEEADSAALDIGTPARENDEDLLHGLLQHSTDIWDITEYHTLVTTSIVSSLEFLGMLDTLHLNGLFLSVGQLESILIYCPMIRALRVSLRRDHRDGRPVGKEWIALLQCSRDLETVWLGGNFALDPGDLLPLYEESAPRPSGKLLELHIHGAATSMSAWVSHPAHDRLRARPLPIRVAFLTHDGEPEGMSYFESAHD